MAGKQYRTITEFRVVVIAEPWALDEEAAARGAMQSGTAFGRPSSDTFQVEVTKCDVRPLGEKDLQDGMVASVLARLAREFSEAALLKLADGINETFGRDKK